MSLSSRHDGVWMLRGSLLVGSAAMAALPTLLADTLRRIETSRTGPVIAASDGLAADRLTS